MCSEGSLPFARTAFISEALDFAWSVDIQVKDGNVIWSSWSLLIKTAPSGLPLLLTADICNRLYRKFFIAESRKGLSPRLFSTTDLLCLWSINATAHAVPALESIHSISLPMRMTKATWGKYVLRVSDRSFTKLTDIFKIADTGKGWWEMNLWPRVGSHEARAKLWGNSWDVLGVKVCVLCLAHISLWRGHQFNKIWNVRDDWSLYH